MKLEELCYFLVRFEDKLDLYSAMVSCNFMTNHYLVINTKDFSLSYFSYNSNCAYLQTILEAPYNYPKDYSIEHSIDEDVFIKIPLSTELIKALKSDLKRKTSTIELSSFNELGEASIKLSKEVIKVDYRKVDIEDSILSSLNIRNQVNSDITEGDVFFSNKQQVTTLGDFIVVEFCGVYVIEADVVKCEKVMKRDNDFYLSNYIEECSTLVISSLMNLSYFSMKVLKKVTGEVN